MLRTMTEILHRARAARKPVLFLVLAAPEEKELRERVEGLSMHGKRAVQRERVRAIRRFWRGLGFARVGESLWFG